MNRHWRTLPKELKLFPGNPLLHGAVAHPQGVYFSVFSRHATGMILCLYESPHDETPAQSLRLDPDSNRTGDIWHCYVPGLRAGTLYLWRAEGPFKPQEGHRFNPNKVLIDPYAKALTDGTLDLCSALAYDENSPEKDLSFSDRPNDGCMPKCVVVEDDFDWEGDVPLNYPLKDCIIYETHVRGLTKSPSSKVKHRGTYRGVVEMIPYFKDLGIMSLEFLPVQEFDSSERFRRNPISGEKLSNYWGYEPLAFFAPKTAYAFPEGTDHDSFDPAYPVKEFKYMVRELHKAGIEVILDVVFNHTAEGNELGPTLSFRGLDNSIYYMLADDKRFYRNYSGCGNTLNCNHPVMRSFIMDCLRYWVVSMHVDGFRFDLGSILGRDNRGNLLQNPPVIESIAEDPLLRETKIIAEAWDAGGAYQVGSFPGGRWAEWNDRYRDDVRRFWRGDNGITPLLATRITGSSDLYLKNGKRPFHSINFVTSHDGFTMNDLVCYQQKHNEANGEQNLDGLDENYSSNYGVEGPSDIPFIEETRNRQIKNFFATLLLSIGTPMILGGDEFRRTQQGNNNAYCHDSELTWYDWNLLKKHRDIYRCVKLLIAFRKTHAAFRREDFFRGVSKEDPRPKRPAIDTTAAKLKLPAIDTTAAQSTQPSVDISPNQGLEETPPDILWYDEQGNPPQWEKLGKVLIARINEHTHVQNLRYSYILAFNASSEAIQIRLPYEQETDTWSRVVDTSLPPPHDIEEGNYPVLADQKDYVMAPRSFVLLISSVPVTDNGGSG
ncbi:MAG TPA: glycogen debranching enzyme GlgX [Spirochaetaceae bacterium]|nr:glycogen debranching enzyme GlgX [Spirochaetaceae bacterium]